MRSRVGVTAFHQVSHSDDKTVLHFSRSLRKPSYTSCLFNLTQRHSAQRLIQLFYFITCMYIKGTELSYKFIELFLRDSFA